VVANPLLRVVRYRDVDSRICVFHETLVCNSNSI
jgi:hypothetical protein